MTRSNLDATIPGHTRMLVAGASGYLGMPLYEAARAAGHARGTSREDPSLLPLRLETPATFDYGVVSEVDVVLLTASVSSPETCRQEHSRAWTINVAGTSRFIENVLARGARLVFFSSDTVYGQRSAPFDESTPGNPGDDYALMKHEVEGRFAGEANFKTIRISFVFSYGDKFTTYLRKCARNREEAELFHPFRRAVIHRDDVTEGAIALARRWDEFPQKVINFGGPRVVTRLEFAAILRETALSELRTRIVDPKVDFFKIRPRTIRMRSPILTSLLGRPPRSLREAAIIEFQRRTGVRGD